MVIPTEVDRLLGPVDVFGSHAGLGKIDFPCEFLHLPLGWIRLVDRRHMPARRRECFGCTMLDLKILLLLRWWRQVVLLRRLRNLVMLLVHRLMHWLLVGVCSCIAVHCRPVLLELQELLAVPEQMGRFLHVVLWIEVG